ncbi:MAG: hypothetical protein PHE80_00220 [Candidatus Omnitrophica bacterium]|nr:hypothetical protein [Candidatus Omnitrophota bacterium]MDD5736834.1 hypothetical protein [Candidatus Omnitrophota bacterium]
MTMIHYALIPAKKHSSRYENKNWREFCEGMSLVDFTIETTPQHLFEKTIVSTDNETRTFPKPVLKHLRDKALATSSASINDLINVIIAEYGLQDEGYIWLLNPTAPFRCGTDYEKIADILNDKKPVAVISASKIHPFIWRDNTPLFETKGKRRNTQDYREIYSVENGMFFVFSVRHFREHGSWNGGATELYLQHSIWSSIDIDTEYDFIQAQKMAPLFLQTKKEKK